MNEISKDYICHKCGADLNSSVKLLGESAFDFHMILHYKNDYFELKKDVDGFQADIEALVKGIKYLRDGGFGCYHEAQTILDASDMSDY